MDRDESKRIIEALLFVSDKPVSIDTLKDVLKDIEPAAVRETIGELNNEYIASGRSFNIKEIAGGFQMLTDPIYSRWVAALYKRGPDRLTGPSLDTLAIIAYKQPITRTDIETIRGVNVDGVLRTLEERNLIRTKGRLDAPGRPILYATTNEFLQHFGLRSLEELPNLKEFQESDLDFVKDAKKHEVINKEASGAESATLSVPAEAEAQDDVAGDREAPACIEEAKEETVHGPEDIAK